MASGQCSFLSVRILEKLSATVAMCVKKYGLLRLFLLACGVCEFTQKLSLDSIYCLIFDVGVILCQMNQKKEKLTHHFRFSSIFISR